MKSKWMVRVMAGGLAAGMLLCLPVFAQVGERLNKNMSQNIHLDEGFLDGIPPEADHAFIKYLRTYVPVQRASGEAADPVEYKDIDGNVSKTRDEAKPLIGVFMYGPVDYPDQVGDENVGGFVGHGKRDAWAAVSLDDGDSWRTSNLSESVERSSINLDGVPYPGDVVNIVHAVAGNRIVAAWPSRFCRTGSPGYSLDEEMEYTRNLSAVATHLGITPAEDLYLTDVFGVAGSQGFVDYTQTEPVFPTVGKVPFNCIWTARGILVEGDDPRTEGVEEASHVVWYKPERLTSGRRDANRVEIAMVEGAGVVLTWQEDPEGLRTGRGLGPGEGWSGSTAHSQTDIWYSFLPWAHMETVIDAVGNPSELVDYWAQDSTKPKPYVPFAVPMRLTNNARCGGEGPGEGAVLYCEATASNYGLRNQCADTVSIPAGRQGDLQDRCVSEDGIPNVANTAATRARVSLQPRLDAQGNTVGGWVIVVAEEDKGLGRYFFKVGESGVTTATTCVEGSEDCAEADVGKNV